MSAPTRPPRYPDDFLWGVATSAYQVEGAFNGPGEPQNNWAEWEARGRVERTGAGCGSWERWEEDLELAGAMGLNALRLSVAWARVEPRAAGGLDAAAIARYADILAGARRRGLEPVVTLHHFSHPAWLGPDPWLDPVMPRRFARYAGAVADALGRALGERHGEPPPRLWVTINEPNALALATYLLGALPRGRRLPGPVPASRALAGMLLAHVRAHRALHGLYDRRGWPRPTVTYNAWACAAYAADRWLIDLLRPATRHHTDALGRAFERHLDPAERAVGRALRALLRPAAFAPVVQTLGPGEDPLDVLALDYYDPFLTDYVTWRGVRRHPWQWRARPDRLAGFLDAWLDGHADKRLLILEHGIALRHRPGAVATRPDGLTRGAALAQTLGALDTAIAAGRPIAGYFHWSLIDNYEWGSFAPRFGLHAVDYAAGARRMPTDAGGEPVAARYRELIAARRA